MAHFFPHDRFDEFKHDSERTVARALARTLPAETRIYHGHLFLQAVANYGGPGTHLKEGEIDFVLLDPEHGLLIIEVKGGPVDFDADTGQWCYDRGGRREPMKRSPVVQARENMHALVDRMLNGTFKGSSHLPCPYGYALIFPDRNPVGAPPGADQAITLGARDLSELGTKLLQALGRWRCSTAVAPVSPNTWRRLCEGVTGGFRLIEVLARQLDAQEEILVRLTGEQERALTGLYANPRVLVKGVAGSGKTMLAVARARRFAIQGKSTLLLCFNGQLAAWLDGQIPPDLRTHLEVFTFNGLCKQFCAWAKVKYQPPPEEDREARSRFYEETAPNLLDHAMNQVSRRYEAIVIDEGQDFRPNWWTPIELLNVQAEKGPFYVFYDPDQNFYLEEDFALPDLLVPYELQANCRNTRRIASLCGTILGKELPVSEDAPLGMEPVVEVLPNQAARRDRCLHQVREWLGQEALKPQRIAILSPWTQPNSCLSAVSSLGGMPLTQNLDSWQRGEGVLFSTIKAFKGLEADAIIIADLMVPRTRQQHSELYVACSRAKHLPRLYYA